MDEEGMPLTEFVNQSITKIMAGLPNGIKLKDSIDFELSVVLTKGVDGSFAFNVLKLGANKKTEEFQKIRFSVTDKEPEIDPIKEAQKNLLRKRGLL
ncbi:hypothetical protein J4480_01240 [Candidatus Woesearchaeota archaeon]|nr:hypothetical protein [Candidatus Woesearchaeota archaeon]